ncbi:MAG: HAMP domain-containing histidine kinase [Acidimicrobiia bacterium]|nr:HAMP domain-containing histidine kinase [Acidimicrobiia bacterium]
MARLTALLVAALIVGLLFVELTMRPTAEERLVFATIFGSLAVVALLTTPLLLRFARSSRRFRDALTVAASTAVFVGVAVVGVAAAGMFLSEHDLRLTLVSLATGTLVAIAQLWALSSALSSDLSQVGDTVNRLMDGDLAARAELDRTDELGRLAASIDALGERLEGLEAEREADERARNELLANVGHDLRTPLTSMRVAVEALQDGVARNEGAYLSSIATDIRHLTQLVEDVFLLARLEVGDIAFDRTTIDLADLADESVQALTPVADRNGVALELDVGGVAMANGDVAQLGRALRNLIDNAIRHADAEVRVHVRGEGEASVVVRDDGPGFPPGMTDTAFDRFSRGDEARARDGAGAGLGLAIAHHIATGHDGDLTLLDGPGGALRLRLPSA